MQLEESPLMQETKAFSVPKVVRKDMAKKTIGFKAITVTVEIQGKWWLEVIAVSLSEEFKLYLRLRRSKLMHCTANRIRLQRKAISVT